MAVLKTKAGQIVCPACKSQIGADGKTLVSRSKRLIELEGIEKDLESVDVEETWKRISKLEKELESARTELRSARSEIVELKKKVEAKNVRENAGSVESSSQQAGPPKPKPKPGSGWRDW